VIVPHKVNVAGVLRLEFENCPGGGMARTTIDDDDFDISAGWQGRGEHSLQVPPNQQFFAT
jgi:hypothetical protein